MQNLGDGQGSPEYKTLESTFNLQKDRALLIVYNMVWNETNFVQPLLYSACIMYQAGMLNEVASLFGSNGALISFFGRSGAF